MTLSASTVVRAACVLSALLLSGCVIPLPFFEEGCGDGKDESDGEFTASDEEGVLYSLIPVGAVGRKRGPADLGAIACVSNDVFWAASDSDGVACELRLRFDPYSGRILSYGTGRTVKLEGCVDVEGLAYDPLQSVLWASDESGSRISAHRLGDGKRLSELSVPSCYARCRANLSLESLTVREDGLEMWTCNEAPLVGDGDMSTKNSTSLVRLTRFTRTDSLSPWRPSGQWAYPVGRMHGGSFRGVQVRGVSDLCVLPDGTLLTLEREFSWNVVPCFRCRIYQVGFAGATDVTERGRITDPDIVPVRKRRLWVDDTTFSNYEGMCLGRRLNDGSRVLLLVSDGDDHAGEDLFAFRVKREE